MAYSVIVVGINPSVHGDLPSRSEQVYKAFTTIKRILDHDIVCFMNLPYGRELTRVSVRLLTADLKQRVHTAILNELPYVDVTIVDREERQNEDETGRVE